MITNMACNQFLSRYVVGLSDYMGREYS